MKLYLGGVRGGRPETDAAYQQVGGNTTSFLIEGAGDERIIIDAGTGIVPIGRRLDANPPESHSLLLLFSHFHLDHLVGLPSFRPIYDQTWTLEMAAQVFGELTVEDIVSSFIQPPFWPLPLETMESVKRFRILDDESMAAPSAYGGLNVRWCPTMHPGGSTAFRIDEPATGKGLVIATDLEWSESSPEQQEQLVDLCATPCAADWLVFDGKYAPGQYAPYRGWGHSTWQEGIDLARDSGVEHLLITHHGNDLNDEGAAAREREIQAVWSQAALAREGMELSL